MGRKNKKRRHRSSSLPPPGNPLFSNQQLFLQSLSKTERSEFFSPDISPERRAELWMEQAELGEELIEQHSWATPDDSAIKILKEFSPIIEIGCGANAYWCKMMHQAGIDVIGYDKNVREGGKIKKGEGKGNYAQAPFSVRSGGPKVLAHDAHAHRTLFLCYPDEEDEEDDNEDGATPKSSMGAQCLDCFQGKYIIHVGELALLGDPTLSMDQAPWGRSSSPEFQERLAAEYHCLLKVQLPNWLHVRDSISVWKRSEKSTIVFAVGDSGSEDDGDEKEDEEIEYRHIPVSERLVPINLAAPCLAHLLPTNPNEGKTGFSSQERGTTLKEEKAQEEEKSLEPQEERPRKKRKVVSSSNDDGKRGNETVASKEQKQQEEELQVKNESPEYHRKKKKKSKMKSDNDHYNIKWKGDDGYVCPW